MRDLLLEHRSGAERMRREREGLCDCDLTTAAIKSSARARTHSLMVQECN